jgi:SlyX protein
MEERLNDLEVKIAFQDQVIEDLNQVVIELRRKVEALERKLEDSEGIENLKDMSQEIPPPHY